MNFRLTFLLVVALIAVGGAFVVLRSGDSDNQQVLEPWLWKVNLEDIVRIAVDHQGQSLSYALKGEQWVIEDGNDTPVFQDKWGGITLALSGPRPDRGNLIKPGQDLSQFGLDPPVTVTRVTDRSGQVVEFQLGDPTPNQENQYIRLSRGSVSTIPKIWGTVVAKLVTQPPYPPPWLSTLGAEKIEGLVVTRLGETAEDDLTVLYDLVDDQWLVSDINADKVSVPVEEGRWAEVTPAFNGQVARTLDQLLEDPDEYGLGEPWVALELRPREEAPITYWLGNPTPDGQGRYMFEPGTATLMTVDADWAELVASLATDPPFPS